MRNISLAILSALFCFTAVQAQQKNISLEGSGNIITKEVDVKPFDAIKVKGLYELILIQGDKDGVKLEADDNLMYLFDVSNDGSTLVINMPQLNNMHDVNISGKGKKDKLNLKVYVTFKNLKTLEAGVIGNIRTQAPLKLTSFALDSKNVGNITLALTAEKLLVKNNGVGNITLSGSAAAVTLLNTGVGQIQADELVVQNMNITNTGVGNAHVNVVKSISVKDSFLGKVKNSGAAKTRKMDGVEL